MAKKKLPKELDELIKEVHELQNEALEDELQEIPITKREG